MLKGFNKFYFNILTFSLILLLLSVFPTVVLSEPKRLGDYPESIQKRFSEILIGGTHGTCDHYPDAYDPNSKDQDPLTAIIADPSGKFDGITESNPYKDCYITKKEEVNYGYNNKQFSCVITFLCKNYQPCSDKASYDNYEDAIIDTENYLNSTNQVAPKPPKTAAGYNCNRLNKEEWAEAFFHASGEFEALAQCINPDNPRKVICSQAEGQVKAQKKRIAICKRWITEHDSYENPEFCTEAISRMCSALFFLEKHCPTGEEDPTLKEYEEKNGADGIFTNENSNSIDESSYNNRDMY